MSAFWLRPPTKSADVILEYSLRIWPSSVWMLVEISHSLKDDTMTSLLGSFLTFLSSLFLSCQWILTDRHPGSAKPTLIGHLLSEMNIIYLLYDSEIPSDFPLQLFMTSFSPTAQSQIKLFPVQSNLLN